MLVLVGVLLLLGFVLRLLLPYRWLSFRSAALLNRIPGPKALPVLGNILELNIPHEELLPKLLRHSQHYGSIWKMLVLGIPEVFLSDPEDIELVMNSRNFITKGIDYDMLHSWLGTGLLTSTGDKWFKHRKILTPAFHFKILESYVHTFNKNSATLVNTLDSLMDTEYIEINKLVTLCTLDIICETAMGVPINAQRGGHGDYVRAVKRMSELFHHRQMSFWLYHPWSYWLSSSGREETRLVNILHSFTEKVIKERKADYLAQKSQSIIDADTIRRSKRHRTFLDILIEVAHASGLSETDIREEVDTFMFEGHDTTSAAICWALFLLGGHQDVQDKVAEELRGIFGSSDREPDYNDLQEMKYLEQVIKESLRLYPSVAGFSRFTDVDLKIKGYVIPAGTNIPILPYVLHRNPDIFPEPEVFNPDHFLPERMQGRHPFAYLPFSAGPRNCIGQRFALLEEKAVLSAVLRRFRVTSLDRQEDVKVLLELILRPTRDLRITLSPRV